MTAVLGEIVLRKDPGTTILAYTYKGELANVVWVTMNGRRCAFSYDHVGRRIIAKASSLGGAILAEFDNTTPADAIRAAFAELVDAPVPA